MAVVYDLDTKNDRMTAVRDRIDSGSGPGVLQIGTAGMASVLVWGCGASVAIQLAEFTLNDPCGTVSGGVLGFSGFPKTDSSANNTGTAAAARIRDSNSNTRVSGLTVGTSSADIILDSVSVTAGQQVTINSASITHAA